MLIREMMATLEMAESRHISRKWIKLELAAGFWKGAEGQIVDGGAWTLDLLTNCSCVVVCTDVTQDGVIIITITVFCQHYKDHLLSEGSVTPQTHFISIFCNLV